MNILNIIKSPQVIKDHGVPDLVVQSCCCFYIQRFCEKMVSLNTMGSLALVGVLINPMKVVTWSLMENTKTCVQQ